MADQQIKVSVYSLADLKNTSDDAIPNYLNSLGFKQNHTLSDVRLALGYAAFAVSAFTFYWDYKLGFENTKYYTAAAVALYTCLNGGLTFWIWAVEKGLVYAGTSPTGDKIEISTSAKKNVPVYNLSITYYDAAQPTVDHTIKVARPFMQWFDAAGHFIPLPFQQMFAGEVPLIGKADPMKAVTASGKVVPSTPIGSDNLKAAIDSIMAGTSTGSDAKKGGKSRKKA
ncbi:MAG: hypothetical protein M1818_000811 [Claussenomyces sp. TS43310]|nr:MAG: hypothetical protein M1818_000811 [Claussenomyces sp. TS43310]